MCSWYKAKLKGLVWSLLCSSIVLILCQIDYVYAIRKGRLMVPSSYTALSGDLHIQLQFAEPLTENFLNLSLEISRLRNNEKQKLDTISLFPDPRSNVSQISLPCRTFFRGGTYELEVVSTEPSDNQDERLKQQLDVRWPTPKLSVTPELIGTYPEGPVDVVLSFPEVECDVKDVDDIPEFWLELIYCGQEVICTTSNGTTAHILYAEKVVGFPRTRLIKLRCELFGLAGHYAIQLRPLQPTPSFVSVISYIRADWSEKFVFNVHARSIFPCDPHSGIGVLFEYPACILDQADRVRLFAKLRADVASLKPPTSLHYVTEQRVMRGQHSLHFDCDFFSEKYVEYCFVYVSQAISGAVADIRMDCVPTLPVSDSDTGGWGPWSEWTPCSTTCSGGTRNRYRFCDSPPPRYGAKFCEGPAVETEHCGKDLTDSWECLYGPEVLLASKTTLDRTEIASEIGPACRCGCIVHLGSSKPRRLLASSAQGCPGRSFWLIQADDDYHVRLKMDYFRLPCSTQYVKIRDGVSRASNLISEFMGNTRINREYTISTGSQILVEFFSDEIASMDGACNGGFLAHVEQIQSENDNVTAITSRAVKQKPQIGRGLTMVHIVAVLFASVIIIISALLGAQYILRYRKYHLTANQGEVDSPIHTPRASIGSLHNPSSPPSRAMSTTTLLSEVIYLVKIRPRGRMKHSILRESVDAEALVKETELNDEVERSKCGDSQSIGSVHTLTNEINNDDGSSSYVDKEISSASPHDNESIHSQRSVSSIHCENTIDTPVPRRKFKPDKSSRLNSEATRSRILDEVKEDETETDTDSLKQQPRRQRRFLSVSNTTLTNGCYSPAASIISTATIRTTNQKESKDKQNRQKLLARPDSEFSLANPEDLELDYYDYNVVNAGAAPGSYLGMDPAYLVWIPPLDEGIIISDIDKIPEPHYEEILPHYKHLDPGSNKETPEEEAPELPPMNTRKTKDENDHIKNSLLQKTIVAALLKEDTPLLNTRRSSVSSSKINVQSNSDSIQLTERPEKPTSKYIAPQKTHVRKSSDFEKETSVVKSPSDLQDYYELDDIQFADDDDSNESDNSKSKTLTIRYNPTFQVGI